MKKLVKKLVISRKLFIYEEFSTNDKLLNELLHEGSLKARVMAKEKIAVVRELIGIKPIS